MAQAKWSVPVQEALDWPLHRASLRDEITDRAEDDLGVILDDGTIVVTVVGDDFVATYTPAGEEAKSGS